MSQKRTHSAVTANVSRKCQRGEEVDIEPHDQGSSDAAQCKASVMDTVAHVTSFLRDSGDSGPQCIDLEPSESSDGASTSTGDARPGRLAEIADKLKADDVPSTTDDMMNVLTSAMPELRGSLAERARSLLAEGRTPLGAMLRSVVRYTARGPPPEIQIAGRSTRSEDPSQSTLKKTEEKQPPEFSYLLTPSPRYGQSSFNLGLVSFTTLPNTPASSKCDSVSGTDLPTKLPTEQQEHPGSQGNRTKQQNTLPNYFDYIKKYQHVDSTNQTQTPKIDGNPANVEKEFLNQTNCQLEDTKKNTDTQSENTVDKEKAKNKADLKMEIEKNSDDGPNKANDNGTGLDIDDVLMVNDTPPDIVDLTALDSPEVNTTPMKFEPISSDEDSTIINLTIEDDDDDDIFRTVSDVTSAHTQTLINNKDEKDDFLPALNLPKPIPMNSVPLKQEPIQAEPAEAKPGRANSQARSARADRRVRKRGRRGPRAPRGPRGPRTSFETPRPGFHDIANDLFAPATGISFKYSPLFDMPEENDGEKEEEEEDEEEMGVAETYAPYRPANSQNWCEHPDQVVETASLSSVEAADMTYALSLPGETVARGQLSAVQLEAVVYAAQAHDHLLPCGWRAGYFIGDGAGVGKGRTIAGIIFENYLKGRKRAIWVSVSNDLKYDAERDLRDIGAGDLMPVHSLNKMTYSSLSSPQNGVSEGVVFSTYASLIAKGGAGAAAAGFHTRLDQLCAWCGPDFDGCIVFDECHKAKNLWPVAQLNPSKTGLAVLQLQMLLPNARLVYASATGASEPKDMAYMVRLGIWGEGTPFPTFNDFLLAVERRGVGAMEVVAMDMKLRGMYIARQLSFHGVTFKIEEVPLSEPFRETYDKAVALWVVALGMFQSGLELVNPPQRWRKIVWRQFWGAHQRFFKYMCIAAKVSATVERAQAAVRGGRSVVIGLQATGEALAQAQLVLPGRQGFVCSARCVFQNLVEKQFPDPDIMKKDDDPPAPAAIRDRTKEMREELLLRMAELAGRLPPNALDELVHRLGGAARVAEMTGRKYRVVENNGQFVYESRSESNTPLEILNLTEKQRFMDGEKDVAIISEAASSGISLQSDKRVKNQKQRVHITLELPWSADRAVQQFGRTHRSNQANAPEYVFLISDLVGEWRFASTVAKRLESLGALTHGDRRATDTLDLSQFNIENKFGRSALKHVQRVVCGKDAPLVAPPADYPGNFLRDAAAALANVGVNLKETVNIQRFLNRLLGVPVRLQNAIFRYFSDIFVYTVNQAKRSGRFDLGILDLGRTGECVQCVRTVRFLRAHATGCAPVSLHVVRSERGMTWEAALQKHAECRAPGEGFYLTRARCNRQRNAVLCCASGPGTGRNLGHTLYTLYKPNVGQVARAVLLGEVARAHEPAAAPAAGLAWRAQHAASLSVCSHRYWRGACAAPHCEVGLRVRTYHVLSGSVLAVWARVEAVLVQCSILNKTQVVRVRTDQGHKIIGTLFPKSCVEALIEDLKTDSLEYSDQSF